VSGRAVVKGVRYFLAHAPGLVRHGSKPAREIAKEPALWDRMQPHLRSYDAALAYPPNLAFLRSLHPDDLRTIERPWWRHARVRTVAPVPPVADLSRVKLGVVTGGGLVPKGNPDRLVSARAEQFFRYPIGDRSRLVVGEWESVHGGYSTHAVNTRNPIYVIPLDVLREREAMRRRC
jgi:hypothetical protein